MNIRKEIVIIGGGPAGMAAALGAVEQGVEPQDILILERDAQLGGILNQCIHNGFGLHTFKEELTGPEYASRYRRQVEAKQIPYKLHTMVMSLRSGRGEDGYDKEIIAMNKEDGMLMIYARAVILAMGCRERPRGALNIPGYRPAGIYSAGTAQYYVNIEGKMPGKEVVILGSGDIGLIMARRMTLEGAHVQAVAELMPYSGGLKRNIVQCLQDYNIPLLLSHTVVDIEGKDRVEGVTIAQVDSKGKPIPGTEIHYACDTLLLSCGLIPENELSVGCEVELSPVTGGPVVNESLETTIEGVFACGNVLHVHDLVDYVSGEAKEAGMRAASYLSWNAENTQSQEIVQIHPENGVRYTVPSVIRLAHMKDTQTVRFRVGREYRNVKVCIYADDRLLRSLPKKTMAPGEMENIILMKKDMVREDGTAVGSIRITVEEGKEM